MRADLPRDLLLAVVPNTRGIAFTYFEGPLSPVDWGLKETRGAGKNAQSLAALAELLAQLQPDVLILDDYTTGHPRREPRIQRLHCLAEPGQSTLSLLPPMRPPRQSKLCGTQGMTFARRSRLPALSHDTKSPS